MKTSCIRLASIGAVALMLTASGAQCTVRLNNIITGNAVLQQKMAVPIWGTASSGETVTVTFNGQSLSTTAPSTGKWRINLAPMNAGGPFTITARGTSNTVTLNNIEIGEVWVASGQSNMDDVKLNMSDNWQAAVALPDDPHYRFLMGIDRSKSSTPLDQVNGTPSWTVDTQSARPGFSAVAYYFGRELRRKLNVPVGILWSARGATYIEQWMDKLYTQGLGINYIGDGSAFNYAEYYYAMIKPLQPYGIKGVAWYQGETHQDATQYYKQLVAFTKCWRTDWGQGTFPFLIVQIAPFGGATTDGGWAEVREAELKASQTIARTSLALTIDVSNPELIHPTNKQPVGERLADAAMEDVYRLHYSNKESRKHITPGPTYRSMSVVGNTAIITFDNVGSGLVAKGSTPLTGWIVAGSDKVWQEATAEIRGNTVAIWSNAVARPSAVRYGWWDGPIVNLSSVEGYPASPFRTDCPMLK